MQIQIPKLLFSTLAVTVLFSLNIFAQIAEKKEIIGKVISSDSQQAVESASVQLYSAKDSLLIKGKATDKQGSFVFSDIPSGNYYIQIGCVGFNSTIIPAISISNSTQLNLGTIALAPSNIVLEDVSVVYKKAIQDFAIDRKVYNVARDILGQSGSASDVLENIPSVTVDVDGSVSLRGSGNITFFVNGRPSKLLKNNSAVILQQMPANTIERIEVISNPSAKYKPDGIGGIINLIMKKEKKQGFNGTVMANVGNQGRYNSNLTLNYNSGKMNIYGSYGFRQNKSPRTSEQQRINRDSLLSIINRYASTSKSTSRSTSHYGNVGLDYQINDKNRLEFAGNASFQDMGRTQNTLSTWMDADFEVTSQYNTERLTRETDNEWEASVAFLHQFEKEDHEIQFELNVTAYDETENNQYTETYSLPAGKEDISRIFLTKGGPLAEIYAEYTLPMGEETELEAGYVGEFYKDIISNLGEDYDENNNKWIKDLTKSNDFNYEQSVHALYATFSHSFDQFSFMAGLRAEQVFGTSNLLTLDSVVPNNYFRFYPTLHLAYELDDDQQLQLNYSHRVRRADSDEINPFPEYSDPRNMEAGNPLIKPEQIHSVEFGYQLKKELFTVQPTIYYRYKYDGFAEIQEYINDTVLLTTFENLSQDQSMGMEFIATLNAGKFATLNLSTNGYYRTIDASNIGYSANKAAFSLDTKLGINFNVTKSTLLQVYAYHRTARISAQGHSNPLFYVNTGIRQDLFKNRASLILTVSDVFNTLKSEYITDTPYLYKKSRSTRVTQIVYVGFTYRFGKSAKKQAQELKFDDSI